MSKTRKPGISGNYEFVSDLLWYATRWAPAGYKWSYGAPINGPLTG